MSRPVVTLYTDGSFRRPNYGAYAAYASWNNHTVLISEGVYDTTISRMELSAVIESLEFLQCPCIVELYSDSQYVVNTIAKGWLYNWNRNGWRTSSGGQVANIDLMQRLLAQLHRHTVRAHWVKAHNGNAYNELVDERAQYLTAIMRAH